MWKKAAPATVTTFCCEVDFGRDGKNFSCELRYSGKFEDMVARKDDWSWVWADLPDTKAGSAMKMASGAFGLVTLAFMTA